MRVSPTSPSGRFPARRRSRRLRPVVLACVVTVLACLLGVSLSARRARLAPPSSAACGRLAPRLYDVVLDAGSTGSRAHVFEFTRRDGDLLLEREHFERIEPGLSAHAANPQRAADAVAGLLRRAAAAVPAPQRACTSVALKATAGLRLLGAEAQAALLRAVSDALAASGFSSRGAQLISGREEGVFGWLTLNYLVVGGRFAYGEARRRLVTVDMGGASAQVVFEIGERDGEWLPFGYASKILMGGENVYLYQHSYLGFGLNEARRRALRAYDGDRGAFPCFPRGYTHPPAAADDPPTANRATDTAGDPQSFAACLALLERSLFPAAPCAHRSCGMGGLPQPPVPHGTADVYAFSYFYDRLHKLGRVPAEGAVRVATYREAAQAICDRTDMQPHNQDTLCMDLTYLFAFLSRGLGLGEQTPLHVPNRIGGRSVSWSLGASVAYLEHLDV